MIFCSILPLWVNWYGGCFMAVWRWRSVRSRRRRRSCTCSRCLSCICYPDSRTRLTSPARWGGNRSHVVYLHPLLKFTFRSCFCFMDWLCVPPRILSPAFWISGSYWWQLQFLACSWAHLHPLLAPPFDNRFFFCCMLLRFSSCFRFSALVFSTNIRFLFAESGSEMLPGALIMQLCK